ncbi:MAG: hypothetical protein ACE5LL_00510 [Alphaproteobacteria bacterium]
MKAAKELVAMTGEIDGRHLTTRRGFITVAGFGVVGLYGLWAAYGAAPTSLAFLAGEGAEPMEGMGHGHEGGGMSPEEFERLTDAFIEHNMLPDGSVRPARMHREEEEKPHEGEEHAHAGEEQARVEVALPDVYVRCLRFGYEPAVLRLEREVPYRFRIMAVDVSHGAAIQLGPASRMIRCPRNRLVEQRLRFLEAGTYHVYCAVYCGEGHDWMTGHIIVT